MDDSEKRYDRSIRLFGGDGQKEMRSNKAIVIGASGLGTPLIQQVTLLGPAELASADYEVLDETNRNRFIGARHTDANGTSKVQLMDRMIREINPDVASIPIHEGLVSEAVFRAVLNAHWVFGCFDHDGPRAILNELCAAYEKPYIDLASDVLKKGVYGGRVCISSGGQGCLACMGVLDGQAVRRYLENDQAKAIEDGIYGVDRAMLDDKGPSVAPLNAVVAGLAAMEFMVAVTGMRQPQRHLVYRGWEGKVMVVNDKPDPDCPICKGVYGRREKADVERYLRIPHLRKNPE